MSFPSLFLIGASKAGTTAICNALANHPDICFSDKKEPNFFSEFDTDLEEIPNEKLLEYQKLFRVQNPNQILCEGSVKYLNSSNANYWIKRYVPSAKIVIVLRNPVQRVVSLYEMYARLGITQMHQDEAFTANSYIVKQCILYQKILLYINSFSQEQVLVMTFDDFIKSHDQAFHQLCKFIGIPKTPDMFLEKRNKGGVPKSSLLNFLRSRRLVKAAKKVVPSSKHTQIDGFIKSNFFEKISLKPGQKEKLKQFFHEDVKKISDLIDRDLCQEWQLYNNANSGIDRETSRRNR